MNVKLEYWNKMTKEAKEKLFSRSGLDISAVKPAVEEILNTVKTRGDEALREYAHKFDKADLSHISLLVSEDEYEKAEASLSGELKAALDYCIENVKTICEQQKPDAMSFTEIRPGIFAGERPSPLASAGLYVPRGRGSFPSMLYMTAIPAKTAGVPRVQVVTPPNPDGTVDAACLYTAKKCGVDAVYRTGGAQAIAALAYGTETIPKVVKVTGPGSMYVAAAKLLLHGVFDTGLPAGPSESILIADYSADPHLVALDLMVEAEHGSDSAALLLTPSERLAEEVAKEIAELGDELPEPRKTFIKDVFSGYGGIIITEGIDQAIEISNRYAPEHLQLQVADPFALLGKIENAGEVLMGPNVPFSAANYATGVNAVLPTGGGAHTWSAVSVRDFIKYTSVVYATDEGYEGLAGHTAAIADYEGFITHGNAVKNRFPEK
ncbi:MAG: histidinol dehydrogenase [Spirochaetales bacterium]|nr:histidinol dehydrogenase [Spirochaetales bacterium]